MTARHGRSRGLSVLSALGAGSMTAVSSGASSGVVSGIVSGVVSRAVLEAGRRMPARFTAPWLRTNHAGRQVTLLEGPAWVLGAVAGAAGAAPSAPGSALATTIVAVASGSLGALDDLAGGASNKGLKGHLGALSRGEVTTGAVKVVGLGLTGLLGAAIVDRSRGTRGAAGLLSTLVGGAVIAGAANAVNLFDLRPGRALKVTVAAGVPLAASIPAAAAVGSSIGVGRDDLAGTAMLGDTGANAAGALVGLSVVERFGLAGRLVALVGLTALTLASERVSFTEVIEGNPALRRIDEWGRARS